MRPLLKERGGDEDAANLEVRFRAEAGNITGATFRWRGEVWSVEGDRATLHVLFDDPSQQVARGGPGHIGQVLTRMLPLPLPLYGLNIV